MAELPNVLESKMRNIQEMQQENREFQHTVIQRIEAIEQAQDNMREELAQIRSNSFSGSTFERNFTRPERVLPIEENINENTDQTNEARYQNLRNFGFEEDPNFERSSEFLETPNPGTRFQDNRLPPVWGFIAVTSP